MLTISSSSKRLEYILLTSILFLTTFLALTFSAPTPSYANTTDISLDVAAAINMNVTTNCDIALAIDTPFHYCDVTANVQSNVDIGYSLYLSMPEETATTNDNTCIRHSSTIPPATTNPTACSTLNNSHKFNGVTTPTDENGTFITLPSDYTTNPNANLSPFTKGTWGVSYTSTPTTSGTNYTKFTGLPSYTNTPLLIKETTSSTAGDDTALRFAAHYNFTSDTTTNQVTGSYRSTVLITAMGNVPPALIPASDATMQNFTSIQCDMMANYNTTDGEQLANTVSNLEVATLTGKNTVYLTDSRNDQLYRIRKMQDGQCWMIDNLKIHNKTLTSADSDIASGSFALPALTASGYSDSSPYVFDPNGATYADSGVLTYCPADSGTVFVDYPNTTTGCGYFYNWVAATAGTGGSSFVNTTMTASICPKNWNLPTGNFGQFYDLHTALQNPGDGLAAGGGESWQGVYAGYSYSSNSAFQSVNGWYLSATAYSTSTYVHALSFTASGGVPTHGINKNNAMAVRCIL